MRLYFLLGIVLSATACRSVSPSESDIQTAIAQTSVAFPTLTFTIEIALTDTPIPTLTATSMPTHTAQPTYTLTPTITPSLTPDLRIIKGDPFTFILTPEDLPEDSKYYLPGSGWTSPHKNTEIISGWGRERGREYIEKTGRIEGWWVYYTRGSERLRAPELIYNNVIFYEAAEGAQLAVKDYNRVVDKDRSDLDWAYDENYQEELGDKSVALMYKEMQPNGKYKIWYEIHACYRNVAVVVRGYGWEDDVTLEFLVDATKAVLLKLEAAPLSNP